MTITGEKSEDVEVVVEATLMRFVDGDLPPREHAFVARLIAAHPDASRSVLACELLNCTGPELVTVVSVTVQRNDAVSLPPL